MSQRIPGGTWHQWNKTTVGYNITVSSFHVCCVQTIEPENEKPNKMPSDKFPFHEP